MPFKSRAQRRKFAELLVKGEISEETFEEWNRETGRAKLPERVGSTSRRAKAKRRVKPASRKKPSKSSRKSSKRKVTSRRKAKIKRRSR
jgi:hypothetical protein